MQRSWLFGRGDAVTAIGAWLAAAKHRDDTYPNRYRHLTTQWKLCSDTVRTRRNVLCSDTVRTRRKVYLTSVEHAQARRIRAVKLVSDGLPLRIRRRLTLSALPLFEPAAPKSLMPRDNRIARDALMLHPAEAKSALLKVGSSASDRQNHAAHQ